jgi:hypothetical protein
MSIKSKVFAAAATLTLVGGLGAAGASAAGTAGAATPSCGWTCIDIFSRDYGTHHHPGFVLDVLRQANKVGQPIILFRTSNSDPGEDFTIAYQGRVSDFAAVGLMSPALALHYGGGCQFFDIHKQTCTKYYPDDHAYEIEYAPYGVDSGLCIGVPSTAAQNNPVSLQPCGASSKAVWVVDIAHSTGRSLFHLYVPLINGSDTNFSHPFVLTYPKNAHPTDIPRPQLKTRTLQQFSDGGFVNGGTVNANQQWGAIFGPLR